LGESGSGKTTLSNLIKGLYLPEKGRIILNGNKIIDTSNISSLRKYIANVPQDNFITNSSILEI